MVNYLNQPFAVGGRDERYHKKAEIIKNGKKTWTLLDDYPIDLSRYSLKVIYSPYPWKDTCVKFTTCIPPKFTLA